MEEVEFERPEKKFLFSQVTDFRGGGIGKPTTFYIFYRGKEFLALSKEAVDGSCFYHLTFYGVNPPQS